MATQHTARNSGATKRQIKAVVNVLAGQPSRWDRRTEIQLWAFLVDLLQDPNVDEFAVELAINGRVEEWWKGCKPAEPSEISGRQRDAQNILQLYRALRKCSLPAVEAVLDGICRDFAEGFEAADALRTGEEHIRAMFDSVDSRTRAVLVAMAKLFYFDVRGCEEIGQAILGEFSGMDTREVFAACLGAGDMRDWQWLCRMADLAERVHA